MENKNTQENKNQKRKYMLIYALVAFLFIYLGSYTRSVMTTQQISYTEFLNMVEEKKVEKVLISSSEIKIYPKKNDENIEQGKILYTGNVYDDKLIETLKENDVEFSAEQVKNTFITELIFTWLVMPVAFFFILKFIFGKLGGKMGMGGGPMMKLGKSNAKVYKESDIKVTFDDVAGQDEAKESLKEIIDYLNNAEKYKSIGAKLPKGALLVGPPGTGKTLLAKAVAGEANVPFLSISGSNFVEMFAGMGAAKVRDLFEEAEKNAPCIIFIDEIDSIGKSRDSQLQTNDEREQTLNQLLTQMDGFDSSKAVVVLGATNRPEILDKALLRPGRFDRRVIVDRPDLKGRIDILKVHVKGVKLGEDVDLTEIAKSTPGAVGADLANIVNEGALGAVKNNREFVMQEDLREAVEVIIAGKEKKDRILSPKEKRIVAFHEVGHALVAALLEGADPVHKITIVPRTMGALGYTMQLPAEEKYLVSKDELTNQIMVMLGGRSAEEEVFNLLSTGASNDIERATQTARSMVTVYGMTDKFDMMALESVQNRYLDGRPARNCSEETSTLIDSEVLNIIKTCHESTRKLLKENRDLLDEISEYLLEKETIFGDEFMEFIYKKYPELKEKKCKKVKEENTDSNKEIVCTEDSKEDTLENKIEEKDL